VIGPKSKKTKRGAGFIYNIRKVIHRPKVSMVDPNVFYSTKIFLDSETREYQKNVYTIGSFIDDLGGMIEFLHLFGLCLMAPFRQFIFTRQIIKEEKDPK
jgi:hypothetical protein